MINWTKNKHKRNEEGGDIFRPTVPVCYHPEDVSLPPSQEH